MIINTICIKTTSPRSKSWDFSMRRILDEIAFLKALPANKVWCCSENKK